MVVVYPSPSMAGDPNLREVWCKAESGMERINKKEFELQKSNLTQRDKKFGCKKKATNVERKKLPCKKPNKQKKGGDGKGCGGCLSPP